MYFDLLLFPTLIRVMGCRIAAILSRKPVAAISWCAPPSYPISYHHRGHDEVSWEIFTPSAHPFVFLQMCGGHAHGSLVDAIRRGGCGHQFDCSLVRACTDDKLCAMLCLLFACCVTYDIREYHEAHRHILHRS